MRIFLLLACTFQMALAWDPAARLQGLLGVPYVNDAVRDERGRWTTFTHPDQTRTTPGFNCSGFVLTASRLLLEYRGSLDEATRDRLGDSGKNATLGPDWDFAWDLVLNLSEGSKRNVILPGGETSIQGQTGFTLRGFAMSDTQAWNRVLPRFRTNCVYLASLSRVQRGKVQHYHAVLFVKDERGSVWLYQTLPFGHSHRLCISHPAGLARMQTMFGHGKEILIIETETP
jgi:hypothetical protein